MAADYSKDFYQQSWGASGYYEKFSYGVGIDKVCELCLEPFFDYRKRALEIGCGGGAFTERMKNKFKYLTALDVIERPIQFKLYENFSFIELPSKSFNCEGVEPGTIDFAFSYNLFCHLSNEAIKQYVASVNRVLVPGGDFVFMISDIEKIDEPKKANYSLGQSLPMGHFYQNDKTIDIVVDEKEWEICSRDMIPEHRDIIVHLKKK